MGQQSTLTAAQRSAVWRICGRGGLAALLVLGVGGYVLVRMQVAQILEAKLPHATSPAQATPSAGSVATLLAEDGQFIEKLRPHLPSAASIVNEMSYHPTALGRVYVPQSMLDDPRFFKQVAAAVVQFGELPVRLNADAVVRRLKEDYGFLDDVSAGIFEPVAERLFSIVEAAITSLNSRAPDMESVVNAVVRELAPVVPFPVGTIVAWPGPKNSIPQGWHICDGTPIKEIETKSRRALQAALPQGIYGGRIPDYRALFLRGVDDAGAGRDARFRDADRPTRNSHHGAGARSDVGSIQTWGTGVPPPLGKAKPSLATTAGLARRGGDVNVLVQNDPTLNTWSRETRPANVYVFWIVRVG